MIALVGTYQNGYVKLDRDYPSEKPLKVIVTFLEEVDTSSERGLHLSDFSFSKSREALKDYTGSFSEAVIEERRAGL